VYLLEKQWVGGMIYIAAVRFVVPWQYIINDGSGINTSYECKIRGICKTELDCRYQDPHMTVNWTYVTREGLYHWNTFISFVLHNIDNSDIFSYLDILLLHMANPKANFRALVKRRYSGKWIDIYG
jgi:hypothetical protein